MENGGRLYSVNGRRTTGSCPVGSTVRVNTVHNHSTGRLDVYINGSVKKTQYDSGTNFHDRIGAYRTSSGHDPATIYWSSLWFWRK